jgi:hypothetical protein
MTFPCSSVEVRYSQSSSSRSGDWSTKEARKAELVKGRSPKRMGARGAVLPGDKRGSTNPGSSTAQASHGAGIAVGVPHSPHRCVSYSTRH